MALVDACGAAGPCAFIGVPLARRDGRTACRFGGRAPTRSCRRGHGGAPLMSAEPVDRREFLQLAGLFGFGGLRGRSSNVGAPIGNAYEVQTSLSPTDAKLLPIDVDDALRQMSKSRAIFLGEHHNSLADHILQERIIRRLARMGDIAVGLEAVQVPFQSVLDDFGAGKLSDDKLFERTEWDERWKWSFERYLPVLQTCQELRIPLLALSPDSELVKRVRTQGLEALSSAELASCIQDAEGFFEFSKRSMFQSYVDDVIRPSYKLHTDKKILGASLTFKKFYSARILRDEVIASTIVQYLNRRPRTSVVTLVGGDHVKYGYGVPYRVQRLGRGLNIGELSTCTTMLNLRGTDASDNKGGLRLELSAANKDVERIADLLWFSQGAATRKSRVKKLAVAGGDKR